ncbi:murein hydrolase activator EnvC [Telmatospirillum sp. J64-1]|uniref:murein hydrolase activator EnvC family protein n=1 Tax=Telmatospirillum sp. J64-1 TaxID=2502183 RepID=UPI0021027DF0|nr:peptidoglycan DD-metalloendopeptidase family protein [Telmatospirillum sp. J64-1]
MRRLDRRLTDGAAALFLAALLMAGETGSALAQNPPPDRRLKELERALEKGRAEQEALRRQAQALTEELNKLRAEMIEAAKVVQGHEETLSRLEEQLQELTREEATKARALERRREQMTNVLTALQRLAWRPSEALIAQPTSPADTVRSAILLRSAVPQIEESAKDLADELDSLRELRADIGKQRLRISAVTGQIDSEHRRIKTLVERKAQLQQRTEAQTQETAKRVQRMAAEAQDLRELMVKLEEERQRRQAEARARAAAEKAAREAAEREAQAAALKAGRQPPPPKAEPPPAPAQAVAAGRPFTAARGQMPYPVSGSIKARYGDRSETGSTHKGLLIETRNGAQVVAPHDGLVVFAGPFRGYGQLLIIEHGEGYHTLLAGLGQIDGTVGQRLVAGEPVGRMGQGEGRPTLYVEMRHNGQPVNPMSWLAARKDKVTG